MNYIVFDLEWNIAGRVNKVDPAPFREALRKSGFYDEWKAKYGEEAWSALESSVGALT